MLVGVAIIYAVFLDSVITGLETFWVVQALIQLQSKLALRMPIPLLMLVTATIF